MDAIDQLELDVLENAGIEAAMEAGYTARLALNLFFHSAAVILGVTPEALCTEENKRWLLGY